MTPFLLPRLLCRRDPRRTGLTGTTTTISTLLTAIKIVILIAFPMNIYLFYNSNYTLCSPIDFADSPFCNTCVHATIQI